MLLDGLGWSHYSVFAPCIMTQTRVLGRSGGGICSFAFFQKEPSFVCFLQACYNALSYLI